MQTNDGARLPLSARVHRLFTTFHARTAPEQSAADVARSVSALLGRTVAAEEIEALRSGHYDHDTADAQVLAGLAEHFGVDPVYLTGDTAIATYVDRQLQMLAATRDAGVRNLALRGDNVDISELTDHLRQLGERATDSSKEPKEPDETNRPDSPDLGN
ncbi:hypothetical protein [Nocardia otitidiscaviarum]|uniref:hypothetical protein n=1 Tax=Nocardia otitidiscaviarum TaxID=1823 RepID=UPI001E2A0038|nr:hypothetical protein [Nocardia otitidiscaviarum]